MGARRGKTKLATLLLGQLLFAYFCLAVRAAAPVTDELQTTTTVADGAYFTTASGLEVEAVSSDRTSNAIPEAEENGLEALGRKPHADGASKKSRVQELLKPYPYLKNATEPRKTHQSKRSEQPDLLAFNASFTIELSEANTVSPDVTTTTEISSTTYPTETTTSSEEETISTTMSTTEEQATETSATTVPAETELTTRSTESVTETSTTIVTPSSSETPTASSSSTTEMLTVSSVSTESEVPVTSIETTTPEATTLPVSNEPTTTETSTTVTPASTLQINDELVSSGKTTRAAETTSTIPIETTTMTTSTSTTTTTTATTTTTTAAATATTTAAIETTTVTESPATRASSIASTDGPKETLMTTMTSEAYSITTWQDELASESTTDVVTPTPPPAEEVTLLIRIVFEGTWHDVCAKLPVLRQSLADLVNSSMDKTIIPMQIMFHQTQCSSDNLMAKPLMSEVPLTPLLVYVIDENGAFDEKLTKLLPSLYEMTPVDFPLTVHSFSLVQEPADSGNAIAVVVVSCVAFICLILLAGLLFIMRKRQGRFNYGERCRPVSLDAYSLDSVSAYNSVRRSKVLLRSSKRSYGNPAFEDSSLVPAHPLDLPGLVSFSDDASAVSEEFASIPQVSAKIDELPPGADVKNRYANVIPLPETRVPLQRVNGDPLSEYINASYVRGPKNTSRYYIACQAPTDDTVSDFWRMIWEQQCRVIIMLTDLVENGVEKCAEYIPPLEVSDCHRLYGDFQVTLKRREAKEKYAISTLHLKNLENNTFREVSHIWYLWPANGVPTDAASLIAVLLEARALQRSAAGPILVHCSPGTGRTGTVIALDLCIRQYEVTRTVDVPRVVYTIRRDRAGAVQTREQYSFIYKGLKLYAGKLANGTADS